MPDMLVSLYALGNNSAVYDALEKKGVLLKRVIAPDKYLVTQWVEENFGSGWAAQAETSLCRVPSGCYVAVKEKKIVGFGCFDATNRNFFGPTGVLEPMRGMGIGAGLLLKCLESMREEGYAYAFIGSAGPLDFYRKICGAVVVEGSDPGIYAQKIAY